jgi:solute carrier family 25 phosphate transporter 3
VPYTATTFVVYEHVLEQAYKWVDKATISGPATTAINLGCGMVAGVAAAFVSHPADTWLSKVNGEKGQTGEGTLARLWRIARDAGVRGSFSGLPARLVMVGGMTAVQFGIYGDIKPALGASGGIEIK